MHIMEGYLPAAHAVGWWAASAPFIAYGVHSVKKTLEERPDAKLLLGASGGFAFVLSALKLPSVEMTKGRCEGPVLSFDRSPMTVIGGKAHAWKPQEHDRRCGKRGGEEFRDVAHYAASPLVAFARAAPLDPSTDWVMLPGSFFGFSISPTTGMMIRKNAK